MPPWAYLTFDRADAVIDRSVVSPVKLLSDEFEEEFYSNLFTHTKLRSTQVLFVCPSAHISVEIGIGRRKVAFSVKL